jgi:ABC-type dipeptide/oligopeptide/nickel transport system permease component
VILYLLRRFGFLILIVFSVTVITFFLSHIVPGDPARLAAGISADKTQVDAIKKDLGLDLPIPEQYAHYFWRLVHFDFGVSIVTKEPVRDELGHRLPATLELVAVSFLTYLVIGVTLAVLAATTRRPTLDALIRILTTAAYAIPPFVLAFWLQVLLFFHFGWLPASDRLDITATPPSHITGFFLVDSLLTGKIHTFVDALKHILMPAIAITLGLMAISVRVLRSTLITEQSRDYVRMLRLKGEPERRIIMRNHLRNALVPTIALVGIQFGYLIGGTVVVETIFNWPGIGTYAFNSIAALDYAPVMGVALVTTALFVIINLVVDLLYPVIDPRIRLWGHPQ